MRFLSLALLLLVLPKGHFFAQSLNPATNAPLPDFPLQDVREARGKRWKVPGYTLSARNLYLGYGRNDADREVVLFRYPQTNIATTYAEIDTSATRLSGHGAYSYRSPDGHTYLAGQLDDNNATGDWLSIRIDTAACREALAFDTPAGQALRILRDCATDTLVQQRITVDRVSYRDGLLDGPASSARLDGQPLRTLTYSSGKPLGEEVHYRDGEVYQRIQHTKTHSDTTYAEPSRLDSLRALARDANDPVEQMPAYPAPNCPQIDFDAATAAEKAAYRECTTRAMLVHIYTNIDYPLSSVKLGVQGTSVVTFVVERDGSITNARTASFVSAPIDAEALRIVKSMPPWRPGIQAGEPVRVQFELPIKFRLQ